MSIGAVQVSSVGSVSAATGASPAVPPERAKLLPEPSVGALTGSDPLSVMYLFESKDQQDDVNSGTKRVQALRSERSQAVQKELAAIQQEDDASKHKSFWDDLGSICGEVAKVAGVVASVAAAVVTCGAATPLAVLAVAGAVMSTAAFVDGEFHVLHALGVDDKIAGYIDLGLSIGGAACSLGAGLAAGGQVASSTATTIGRGASVVSGASAVAAGTAAIESGQERANVDRADADQVVAEAMSDHLLRTIQSVIDEVQDSDEKSKQIMKTIVSTKGIQNDTAETAAGAVQGKAS
jgi:hypothetical protein